MKRIDFDDMFNGFTVRPKPAPSRQRLCSEIAMDTPATFEAVELLRMVQRACAGCATMRWIEVDKRTSDTMKSHAKLYLDSEVPNLRAIAEANPELAIEFEASFRNILDPKKMGR